MTLYECTISPEAGRCLGRPDLTGAPLLCAAYSEDEPVPAGGTIIAKDLWLRELNGFGGHLPGDRVGGCITVTLTEKDAGS